LELQVDPEVHGYHRADVDILGIGGKPRTGHLEVIGVKWNVRDSKTPRCVGVHAALKGADRIADFTVAFGTTAPEGSKTVPVIVVEFPVD
jgi:hypothetical protein